MIVYNRAEQLFVFYNLKHGTNQKYDGISVSNLFIELKKMRNFSTLYNYTRNDVRLDVSATMQMKKIKNSSQTTLTLRIYNPKYNQNTEIMFMNYKAISKGQIK